MSKQLGTVDIDELVSGEDRAIEDALRTLALEVNAKLALWVFGVGLARQRPIRHAVCSQGTLHFLWNVQWVCARDAPL